MDQYINPGILLKFYRKNNRLLQKEIASHLNISREYYSKLENNKVLPSRRLSKRIWHLMMTSNPSICGQSEICHKCTRLNNNYREFIYLIIWTLSFKKTDEPI